MHTFSNRITLVDELSLAIVKVLKESISTNGKASLAVSGGSTPVTLFHTLSNMELDWQSIYINLVDERWVDPRNDDSNEKLVREHLLQNKAKSANFIGMKNDATTPRAGAQHYERQLATQPLPYDVLLLGMGNDGHTASLFPGAANLEKAIDMTSSKMVIDMIPLTAPHERLTLTLPAILSAKNIFLHITGKNKKEVLEQAKLPGTYEDFPIRLVLFGASPPLSIYWAQ